MGDGISDAINGMWDSLTGVSQGNGLRVEFPIVKDPGGTVMGFLLGQESDLVKVTADYKVDIDKTFNLSPVPGIIIGFSGQGSFVAHAGLGYDTVGLRDAIAPFTTAEGSILASFLTDCGSIRKPGFRATERSTSPGASEFPKPA